MLLSKSSKDIFIIFLLTTAIYYIKYLRPAVFISIKIYGLLAEFSYEHITGVNSFFNRV